MFDTKQFTMPDGRRIAYRHIRGTGPALVFLPGYMSDMDGGKATAMFDWARQQGRACLLLDYSGCGQSGGSFADGTLSRWREEVLALIEVSEHVRSGRWDAVIVDCAPTAETLRLLALAADLPFTADRLDGLLGLCKFSAASESG